MLCFFLPSSLLLHDLLEISKVEYRKEQIAHLENLNKLKVSDC